MRTHHLSDRTWIFMLLIYLCLIDLPFIVARTDSAESFIKGDSFYYRAVIDSLLRDGDLLLENNIPGNRLNGQLALGQAGFVPKHPILMPLVSIPFYLPFGTPGLLLFNIFDYMILILLIFKLNSLFYPRLIAFVTTILYMSGTLFLEYTYNYSPDIFATVLLLAGLHFTLRGRFYLSAALLGLSVFAKLSNAPLAGLTLLYAGFVILRGERMKGVVKENVRSKVMVILKVAVIFVIALAPFAYTNYLLFGSPLISGYQRAAVAGADGQVLLEDHTDKFNQPLFEGIYLSLFDPRNGVILTNPVLILALLGVFRIRRIAAPEIYLILLICLIQFLLFAKYDFWYTSDFSNRFLMTFVALSSVFTGNFLSYIGLKFSPEASIGENIL